MVLFTRFSRSRDGDLYITSTAVVMSELIKLAVCFVIVFIEEKCDFVLFKNSLKENIFNDLYDCFLVSIPGVLYTIQNNLLFIGYSNLDAVSFQVCIQYIYVYIYIRMYII